MEHKKITVVRKDMNQYVLIKNMIASKRYTPAQISEIVRNIRKYSEAVVSL